MKAWLFLHVYLLHAVYCTYDCTYCTYDWTKYMCSSWPDFPEGIVKQLPSNSYNIIGCNISCKVEILHWIFQLKCSFSCLFNNNIVYGSKNTFHWICYNFCS